MQTAAGERTRYLFPYKVLGQNQNQMEYNFRLAATHRLRELLSKSTQIRVMPSPNICSKIILNQMFRFCNWQFIDCQAQSSCFDHTWKYNEELYYTVPRGFLISLKLENPLRIKLQLTLKRLNNWFILTVWQAMLYWHNELILYAFGGR